MAKRKPTGAVRAGKVLDILEKAHPDARIYLNYENPLQLLVATILAAQCTDERVNLVTPDLFRRYPTAADLAAADQAALEAMIRSTGFYRNKAKSVRECCRAIAEKHGGRVPDDMDALTRLPGVGRKTASIVLLEAFGRDAIAVDTHVMRVAGRLGFSGAKDPDRIADDLCELIPEKRWSRATLVLGTHGRRICAARKPDCPACPVNALCPFYRSGATV